MKHLYLLRSTRHRVMANSSLADYHHPLTRRGENAAIKLGNTMQAKAYLPDLVICAAPARTRQTLANMWSSLNSADKPAPEIIYDYRIHLMRGEAVLQRLQEVDKRFDHVLMISTAPGIGDVAQLLHKPDAALPDPLARELPTGALAVFGFDAPSWSALSPASCALIELIS